MRVARLETIPTEHLVPREVPDPEPGLGELLVDVAMCGICGTDLHILEGRGYRPTVPFVLGHEPVGRVAAVGAGAASDWIGRRIAMTLFTGCGRCSWCQAGDERLCPDLVALIGVIDAPGGFAERMLVPVAQAVPIPDDLSDPEVAALVDAGATAMNSVRTAGAVGGSTAVVVGGGPIGALCAELLRMQGCVVHVVQTSPTRRTALMEMGHRVVERLDALDVRPDLVIDAAGSPEVLPWAVEALAPQGTFVAAGYGPVESFDLAPAARKELLIRGVRSGRRDDLEGVLALAADRRIRLPSVTRWPLAEIDDAIAALRARAVPGKVVIDVRA
ncbi:MAG: alcohol dehydrogenase catalytic domain-containing protein [Chloroflexota bacterium]